MKEVHKCGGLYHFPQLHKGACFYDILSRFHEESGHFTSMGTSKELFGSCPDLRPSIVLPYRAGLISTWLGSSTKITPESIRDNYSAWQYLQLDNRFSDNTLDPIFRADAKPGRRKQAEMRFAVQNRISRMRYCPMCITSDYLEVGEPFWHQAHQIFGVNYCPIHSIPLMESDVSLEKKLSQYVPASTILLSTSIEKMVCISSEKINEENKFKDMHIKLSKKIYWLLEHGLEFSKSNYSMRYKDALGLSSEMSVDIGDKLRDYLLSKIGMDFFANLFPNDTAEYFLKSLKNLMISNLSPLCHALLLTVLDEPDNGTIK